MNKNKAFITIFLVVFIDLLGFGIILPLLPFISERFGANPLTIGLLTATYSFFQLFASPILGKLSDQFGRKKLLIISQVGTAVGFLLLALSHNLPLLFLSRIIDGATGGNISIAQAYMADITIPETRAKGMGVLGAAFGLGFIFGPLLGGFLSQYSYALPAYVACGISLLTICFTVFFLKETVTEKYVTNPSKTYFYSFREIRTIFSVGALRVLFIIFFVINLAFSLLQGNFALWTEKTFHYSAVQNGLLFTYIGILSVIIQLRVLPLVIQKIKEQQTLVSALFFMSIGFFALILFPNKQFVFVALFMFVLGNGLSNPSLQSLVTANSEPDQYGNILGLLHSIGSLGRIFGPIVGGTLFLLNGKDVPFLAGGILALGIFIYSFITFQRNNNHILS